jgi:predicted negative regulator of RcsB-dependent stress response
VEQYRDEDEQVEALRRWWKENGVSTVAAVVIALAAGFGWQAWQSHDAGSQDAASNLYQAMLRSLGTEDVTAEQQGIELAEQLKSEFSGSTYAQFAGLHLAALAVRQNDLPAAEAQLRWVLTKASSGSDTAQIARLRLARVVAASGDVDQALKMLDSGDEGPYAASYAVARGDTLLAAARNEEAREAYSTAVALSAGDARGVNLQVLQQKLESLSPVPPRAVDALASEDAGVGEAIPSATQANEMPEE